MFQEADLAHWLKTIALREGYTVDELEYNFVDADTLFTLNKEYLNHDTDTDIITFDYSESKSIKAEVYISCDALRNNARIHSQTVESECLRLLTHALLHCLGYNDKTTDEKDRMRSKEESYMNLFHVKH
ncbi:MAG: rRNA maturation RNase YbeY [Bacteroidetes bacterium]|jgi:rRNA maturation RNase YbeY|nr:rRNA maturation RNase YbeY [Flavobacteriaceae bacterium]NCF31649.1 rRNA maturation RNase YbeY [Bacteroidota bacterium]|tara:strand:+ start:483 stop:869 length:387 start_codon:yes stop_codon:yes gene_type:complete